MSEKVPDLIFKKIFKNVFSSSVAVITEGMRGGGGGWRSCDLCCVFMLQADVPTETEEEQSEQAAQ